MSEEQDLSPSRYTRKATITVLVGEEATEFHVHEALICSKSPYFAAAAKTQWTNEAGVVELKQISTKAFSRIVNWVYEGKVASEEDLKSLIWQPRNVAELLKAGDFLMMIDFQNYLVDCVWSQGKYKYFYHDLDDVKFAHEYGTTHLPYYQLILKCAARDTVLNHRDIESSVDSLLLYPEALRDVLLMIHKYLLDKWPSVYADRASCYHVPKPEALPSPADTDDTEVGSKEECLTNAL